MIGITRRMKANSLEAELAGIDRLELPLPSRPGSIVRAWAALWPKLIAIAIAVGVWQLVVLAGWRPQYVLPGPVPVFERLAAELGREDMLTAIVITMRRALLGFSLAIAVGAVVGLAVVRFKRLRAAIGASITGLQTMPSIAWFPLAILLFGLSETAIMFVVIIGAAPSVANGIIAGVDHIPRLLLRAGRVLGARGISTYTEVILPASVPHLVTGLKQGWAFAWRSLMAGELLVIIAAQPSLGVQLQFAREISDAEGLLASMIVILLVGILMDGLVFGRLDRWVRRRWGLL
jgi:NitT/TauT family transport system permease protein